MKGDVAGKEVFVAFEKVEAREGQGFTLEHKKFPSTIAEDEGTSSFVLDNAKQYQLEASGDAALSFNKNGVSFDNIDDAGRLVDRKYGHGASIFKEVDDGIGGNSIQIINTSRVTSIIEQANRQIAAASGAPIRWEIGTELGAKGIKKVFETNQINIEVVHTAQLKIIY